MDDSSILTVHHDGITCTSVETVQPARTGLYGVLLLTIDWSNREWAESMF